jgi:DNA-binding LytR/AlgR family response regulator
MVDSQKYKVIIAEDDMQQMELLKKYILDLDLILVSSVSSGVRLIEETKYHQPDIVLLDIGLKKLDGISAFKAILEAGLHPQMIFVTGSLNPEHLLAGFEFDSVDYITKPVRLERLTKAISKAKDQIQAKKLLESNAGDSVKWISLKQNYRDMTIAEDQLVFVEKDKLARNKYNVHLVDGSVIPTSSQLKEIKEMCSESVVFSHRSYLVNLSHVNAIQPDGLFAKNFLISLKHTSSKVPLTKKNYDESVSAYSRFPHHN